MNKINPKDVLLAAVTRQRDELAALVARQSDLIEKASGRHDEMAREMNVLRLAIQQTGAAAQEAWKATAAAEQHAEALRLCMNEDREAQRFAVMAIASGRLASLTDQNLWDILSRYHHENFDDAGDFGDMNRDQKVKRAECLRAAINTALLGNPQ